MCQINMMDGQGYWFQSLHSYESPQIPQPTRIPKSSYYFYCCCCFKHLPKFKIAFIATISTKTTISPKEARPRTTNWTQMVLDFWCLSALSFRSVANLRTNKRQWRHFGTSEIQECGKRQSSNADHPFGIVHGVYAKLVETFNWPNASDLCYLNI